MFERKTGAQMNAQMSVGVENIYPEETVLIQQLVDRGIPTLLVGEAGLGKSYTAELALQGRLHTSVNLSKQHDLVDLMGQFILKDTGKGQPETIWIDGPVPEMAKNGGVMIFEELTMGNPAILAAFHGLADEPKRLRTLGDGNIKVSDDFTVIATANPRWTNYEGVTDLNYAFEDRFAHILFDYPSKDKIAKFVQPALPAFANAGIQFDKFYDGLTELFSMYPNEVGYYMSLRGIKYFCQLIEPLGIDKAMALAYTNKLPPEERDVALEVWDNKLPIAKV